MKCKNEHKAKNWFLRKRRLQEIGGSPPKQRGDQSLDFQTGSAFSPPPAQTSPCNSCIIMNDFQAASRGHNPTPLALSSFSSELTKLDSCRGPSIFILIECDSYPGLLGAGMRPVSTWSGGPAGLSGWPVCMRGLIYRPRWSLQIRSETLFPTPAPPPRTSQSGFPVQGR